TQNPWRNRRVEELLRGGREVPHRPIASRLVLELHHNDRALRVHLLQVPHQRRKRALVRLQRRGCKRRRRVHSLPVPVHVMRIARGVHLHPVRHKVLAAVLPRGKPQRNHMYLVLARLRQDHVHHCEVVLSRLRLHLVPVHRDLHRVHVVVLQRRPQQRQPSRPRAGVPCLRRQHQIGSIVHHQRIPPVLLHQPRDGTRFHLRLHRCDNQHSRQRGANRGRNLHFLHSCLVSETPALHSLKKLYSGCPHSSCFCDERKYNRASALLQSRAHQPILAPAHPRPLS